MTLKLVRINGNHMKLLGHKTRTRFRIKHVHACGEERWYSSLFDTLEHAIDTLKRQQVEQIAWAYHGRIFEELVDENGEIIRSMDVYSTLPY